MRSIIKECPVCGKKGIETTKVTNVLRCPKCDTLFEPNNENISLWEEKEDRPLLIGRYNISYNVYRNIDKKDEEENG